MSTENYDPYYPDQPVVDQYLPVWAKQPAFGPKPAFIWADDDDTTPSYTALTYSELNAAVQRMSLALLQTVSRGDTVLLLAAPGLRLVKLIFACQRAGLVAVPIVPPDPSKLSAPAHHRHLLRAVSQTCPAAAVADAGYISTVMESPVAALKRLRWVSVSHLEILGNDPGPTPTRYMGCGPRETYLIQYTSGATGLPRPVVVTAGAAAHNVRAARKAYDLHPGSVVASWLPQYHDCGLMFLLLTVVSGATCVLASPAAFLRRPRLWLDLVAEFRATCTPVPSFALPLVLRRGRPSSSGQHPGTRTRPLDLGSLRNLILINEPIYKSSVDEFVKEFGRAGLDAASISPSYGLAENCTFVSTAWSRTEAKLPSYKKLLPSARLPSVTSSSEEEPEIRIVIVDAQTGEPVEDGVEGEIWVSSPSNASGYLGHPSASREVFCATLPGRRRTGATFVRTGDCGVVHGTERYLYVLGRNSDAIVASVGTQRRLHAHYIETVAFGSSPESLRAGCIAAFATSPSSSSVVIVAELQKGRRGNNNVHPRSICNGIRRAVWEEEGVKVGHVVLAESGGVAKTTSGKLRRGTVREMLAGKIIPKVFEAFYDDEDDKGATCALGGENETQVCEGASWVVGEAGGEVPGVVVMASGSSTHRLRVQSSL